MPRDVIPDMAMLERERRKENFLRSFRMKPQEQQPSPWDFVNTAHAESMASCQK